MAMPLLLILHLVMAGARPVKRSVFPPAFPAAVTWGPLPTTKPAASLPLSGAALRRVKEAVPHAFLSIPFRGREIGARPNIIMTSIVIVCNFIAIVLEDFMNFVDTLTAYAETTVNLYDRTSGEVTPCAVPTPRQRGPLPIPSWRRGRLPISQAWARRPALPHWHYRFPYRNLLNAQLEKSELSLELIVVVGEGALARRAIRAMVRLGMERMARKGEANDVQFTANPGTTPPEAASGLPDASWAPKLLSAALTSVCPGLGCRA
jgi:hypothetical protein